jgi:hypothetical protein
MDYLAYGVVTALDTSKNAANQDWDWTVLYDHAGMLYPTVDYGADYWGWTRGWTSAAEHPLPPFMALRYRRIPEVAFGGRQHYGYVRTVQCRWGTFSGYWAENYAPYVPIDIDGAHTFHVAQALTLSAFDTYHGGAIPREVVLYYRGGILSAVPVVGYEKDVTTTTSRRFLL